MSKQELPPPSYEEVMNQTTSNDYYPQQPQRPPQLPMRPPQRPPQRPPFPPSDYYHQSQPQLSALPWKYPPGYYCDRCGNTGYKLKNGKTCKRCWERYAPKTSVHRIPVSTPPFLPMPFMGFSQPQPMMVGPPGRVVMPGDPSIGGVLCGRCRGSGQVHNFLDMDLCPVCGGCGRVR